MKTVQSTLTAEAASSTPCAGCISAVEIHDHPPHQSASRSGGTLDALQVMLSKQDRKVEKLRMELRDAIWSRDALKDTIKKLKK